MSGLNQSYRPIPPNPVQTHLRIGIHSGGSYAVADYLIKIKMLTLGLYYYLLKEITLNI